MERKDECTALPSDRVTKDSSVSSVRLDPGERRFGSERSMESGLGGCGGCKDLKDP